nr:MAG TPA: hypothetical protein [Caudoviricetes sp.]
MVSVRYNFIHNIANLKFPILYIICHDTAISIRPAVD